MFITNRLARGLVSVLQGVPGKGKTAVVVAYMNAIACEKPALVGLSDIRRAGACAYMAADSEKADEFKRRDEAFRQRHRLTTADYKHDIYVFDEPGALVEKVGDVWVPSRWIIKQAEVLAELRESGKLAVVVVDTLTGMAGGGKLSDDTDMQAIMQVAKMLATGLDCAVDLVNHLTKGGAKTDPENMDAGGGARALTATPRFVTNIINATQGVIELNEAKLTYRDGPQGMDMLQWVEERIPVEVWEEGVLTGTGVSPIGVLVPVNTLMVQQSQEDVVIAAVDRAIQQGVTVIRSNVGSGGRPADDHVAAIARDALGLPIPKAAAVVERLIEQGRLTVEEGVKLKGRKKTVEVVTLGSGI
jgi:hypothetical protein